MLNEGAGDGTSRLPARFRFAGFEFCADTGEIRREGHCTRLPDQASQVLLALLHARGELVPREDLKKLLWPTKVYGDLEGGLNAAVCKLRQVLEDDGAEPRIIGTVARRGYRLLVQAEDAMELPGETGAPVLPGPGSAVPRLAWVAGGIAACTAAWGLWFALRTPSVPAGRHPGQAWSDPASGLAFVWIPAGTFLMGSPFDERGRRSDETQHPVSLSRGFWLGKYEVTQGQYASVMGTNPSRFREAGLQAPVECVDWGDAQAFLRRLNAQSLGGTYRLPTEAEWEYACRAGSIGSTYGPPGAIAWNAYTSGLRSHPVGEKQANAWGLCDMLGNVSELCEDCYKDPYDTSLDTDPVGPPSNRYHAIRGGSWQSGTTQTRAAHRSSEAEFELRYPMVGFRVACMPPAGKK